MSNGFYKLHGSAEVQAGIFHVDVDRDNEFTKVDGEFHHPWQVSSVNGHKLTFHDHFVYMYDVFIEISHLREERWYTVTPLYAHDVVSMFIERP